MLDSVTRVPGELRGAPKTRDPESSIMSRQISWTSVSVSFSTRKALMPAWMVQHMAAIAGVNGLDVDATSAVGAWLAARSGTIDLPYVPVRSVWLCADDLLSPRSRRFVDRIAEAQPEAPPRVIALLPTGSTLRNLNRSFEATLAVYQPWSVALGLPSLSLRGGRPHLVQLGGIRRFAEEWDLSVAVDLSGQFDPTWEAEAAIARLGDRLSVLRITASAPSRGAVGRDRVACRALHAAIDRDRDLDVAVTPAKSVPFPITPRVASIGARRAVEYIAERGVLHARALREGLGRYEGSPSSRGF